MSAMIPSRRARSIKALAYRRAAAPPLKALPPLPLRGQRGASLTAPRSLLYVRMSIPASIHAHTCTSVQPGSLASEEVRKKAGNVLEFRKLGK